MGARLKKAGGGHDAPCILAATPTEPRCVGSTLFLSVRWGWRFGLSAMANADWAAGGLSGAAPGPRKQDARASLSVVRVLCGRRGARPPPLSRPSFRVLRSLYGCPPRICAAREVGGEEAAHPRPILCLL